MIPACYAIPTLHVPVHYLWVKQSVAAVKYRSIGVDIAFEKIELFLNDHY